MEDGRWDEANETKILLEDKQRASRKERDTLVATAAEQGKTPELQTDPHSVCVVFIGTYVWFL